MRHASAKFPDIPELPPRQEDILTENGTLFCVVILAGEFLPARTFWQAKPRAVAKLVDDGNLLLRALHWDALGKGRTARNHQQFVLHPVLTAIG
jgi:hypothetical protein